MQKKLFIVMLISFFLLIIGFTLSVNLIPVQDLHVEELTEAQKEQILMEGALNYPVGRVLVPVALLFFLPSSVILWISFMVRHYIVRKKKK